MFEIYIYPCDNCFQKWSEEIKRFNYHYQASYVIRLYLLALVFDTLHKEKELSD